MSVTAEPYNLRHAAGRFSCGATELRHKAAQLARSSMNLTQGPGSWQGEGADSFTRKNDRLRAELDQAATILESAANALNRFASKMEHVNELRRQSQQLEQESWQITGDTPDDLHHRQNLTHRAYQLRHEADWEANTADSQASTEFDMMMTQAQHIMEAVGQFMTRTPADEKRDAEYESYYARHRDLYKEEDTTTQMTMGSYKRADYEGVKHLEEQHRQLVAQAREIIKRRDVPGYITDPDEIECIVDDNFQAECGEFTDEELATFIGVQEDSEVLSADMQRRRLAGEDITKHPRYREYLSSQMGLEPTAIGFEGMEALARGPFSRRPQKDNFSHTSEEQRLITEDLDNLQAEVKSYMDDGSLPNQSVEQLNDVLGRIQQSNLIPSQKSKLMSSVIRGHGYTNFDWNGDHTMVKAFTDLNIKFEEFDSPKLLYRRSYEGEENSQYGLGKWYGDKSRTIDETRDELAVMAKWRNPLTAEYVVEAPSGTTALKGTAAPQNFRDEITDELLESREGGAVQYWLNDVDNNWIKVIKGEEK